MSPDKSLPLYSEVVDSQPVPNDPPVIDMYRLDVRDPFEAAIYETVCLYRAQRGALHAITRVASGVIDLATVTNDR